jgi:hypothetical protein
MQNIHFRMHFKFQTCQTCQTNSALNMATWLTSKQVEEFLGGAEKRCDQRKAAPTQTDQRFLRWLGFEVKNTFYIYI